MPKKKKIEENKETGEKKNYESQIKWVLLVLGIIILIVIAAYFVSQEGVKFRYMGLTFEKMKVDKLTLYHDKIAINDESGNLLYYYNLYLRNDPRKLDSIKMPSDVYLSKDVALTVDENIVSGGEGCGEVSLAGATISMFLNSLGKNLTFAYTSQERAEKENIEHITCENNPTNRTVLLISRGTDTEITREGENCYAIKFKDCEVMKGIERFIIGVIAYPQGRNI
jgi:hypothetical protein